MPPVVPGAGALAVMLEQCYIHEVPETKLSRVLSPTGLRLGNSTMAAYYGGLAANTGILLIFALACGFLYLYLTIAGRSRLRRTGSKGRITHAQRLEAARLGPLGYSLAFAHPASVYISAGVFFYGEGAWIGLAALKLVLCGLFPAFACWVVYKAPDYAAVAPIPRSDAEMTPKPWSWLQRLFNGRVAWKPREKQKSTMRHRIYGLFYSGYQWRDRYLFPAQLVLDTLIAVLQSIRPQTEAQCDVIGYLVIVLAAGFALFISVRRSLIAPYDMYGLAAVLWGEVLCKTLLVVFGRGEPGDHWSVVIANQIAQVVGGVLLLHALIGIGGFLYAEYTHWAPLSGGGAQYPEGWHRVAGFLPHWFFFYGVLDAMMGLEEPREQGADSGGSPLARYCPLKSPRARPEPRTSFTRPSPFTDEAKLNVDPASGRAAPQRPEPKEPRNASSRPAAPVHIPLLKSPPEVARPRRGSVAVPPPQQLEGSGEAAPAVAGGPALEGSGRAVPAAVGGPALLLALLPPSRPAAVL
eukprot:TRINITY_DN11113_c0_g2_i1.p1 TRINITY_DN11113_c0_g2~~TRINITY_DN11113_c0_g2_i1.p1  ORF type:complete len:523 (+),score=54.29 TRINITY_DN11113_c0_g2_i1:1567-3135(+)